MSTATTMTEKQPATNIPATSVATTTRQAFRHAMPVLCGIFKQKKYADRINTKYAVFFSSSPN